VTDEWNYRKAVFVERYSRSKISQGPFARPAGSGASAVTSRPTIVGASELERTDER